MSNKHYHEVESQKVDQIATLPQRVAGGGWFAHWRFKINQLNYIYTTLTRKIDLCSYTFVYYNIRIPISLAVKFLVFSLD